MITKRTVIFLFFAFVSLFALPMMVIALDLSNWCKWVVFLICYGGLVGISLWRKDQIIITYRILMSKVRRKIYGALING